MKIQVLGSGCPTCKNLYKLTQTAVSQLCIKADVQYSADISQLIEMGVMQTPVLAIDGRPVLVGSSDLEKVKEAIKKSCCPQGGKDDTTCCCKDNCC